MNTFQEIFLNSFVKGSGKTFGVLLVLGLTWQLYEFIEEPTKFTYKKVPTIQLKEIVNETIKTFSTDIEQIDIDIENEFNNSKIKSIFDDLC